MKQADMTPDAGAHSVDASVIIVTWNAKEFTRQCLESLRGQLSGRTLEVIVVDNASSDGTPALVSQEFPRVVLIENERNLGFARANNIGISLSKGRKLFLINSDVTLPQGCLDKVYSFMENDGSIGLVGPRMLGRDGKARRSCMRFPTLYWSLCRALALDAFAEGSATELKPVDVEVLTGWFWAVRRDAVDEIGLLDDGFFMYGEDLDWCHRFRLAGWRTVFFPDAEAVHYGGASSGEAPIRFYIEMQKAWIRYWKKYNSGATVATHISILWLHEIVRVSGYFLLYLTRNSSRSECRFKISRSGQCLLWLAGLRSA